MKCQICGSDDADEWNVHENPDDVGDTGFYCKRCIEMNAPSRFEVCGECGRLIKYNNGTSFSIVDDDLVCTRCVRSRSA